MERWSGKLADAEWKSHADLKADFPSADFVGNNRYVFNIKGNNCRTVVLVVFFAGTVAIRFIGTHSEYDKIKDILKSANNYRLSDFTLACADSV